MIDRSIALPWVWLNKKMTRAANANVSIFDRSFTLGDGVFDTLRILNTCPLQWREHWRRFCKTARELGFKIPATQTEILAAIQELLRKNKCVDAIARIQLSRGTGPRG
jgi:branched-chain amino acid aminotransferase